MFHVDTSVSTLGRAASTCAASFFSSSAAMALAAIANVLIGTSRTTWTVAEPCGDLYAASPALNAMHVNWHLRSRLEHAAVRAQPPDLTQARRRMGIVGLPETVGAASSPRGRARGKRKENPRNRAPMPRRARAVSFTVLRSCSRLTRSGPHASVTLSRLSVRGRVRDLPPRRFV